jgi:hypothetical protein
MAFLRVQANESTPPIDASQLADMLIDITHFLDGSWRVTEPGQYLADTIQRVYEAMIAASTRPDLVAARQSRVILEGVRVKLGRERDVGWCHGPEDAMAMVSQRMFLAYSGHGKDLEKLAADLRAPEGTQHTPSDDSVHTNQLVSPADVAKKFGLTQKQKERLRKKLTTWRSPANCREWTEVQDRGPKQPKYLYRLGSVQHLIDAAKAKG